MHLAHQKRSIVSVLVLALAAAAFAGCTMVGDNATGVQLDRGQPTTCVKQCNDSYALLFNAEQKRHQAANEACQALPIAEQQACHAVEVTTHENNKAALTAGKVDCQNGCHRQGSGSAG
jgi:hypothetical protein